MPTDNSLITVISPANPRGQIQDRRQVVSKIEILSCKKLYKVGRVGNQAFNKYCLMIQKCITICEKKSSQPTVHTTQATKTSLVGAHNKRSDQGARRNSKSFDSKKGGRRKRRSLWRRLSRLYCTRNNIVVVLTAGSSGSARVYPERQKSSQQVKAPL